MGAFRLTLFHSLFSLFAHGWYTFDVGGEPDWIYDCRVPYPAYDNDHFKGWAYKPAALTDLEPHDPFLIETLPGVSTAEFSIAESDNWPYKGLRRSDGVWTGLSGGGYEINEHQVGFASEPLFSADILGDRNSDRDRKFRLDCDSGINPFKCENRLRPPCDAWCRNRCHHFCAKAGSQEELMACLRENEMDTCSFNVHTTRYIKAKICRRVVATRHGFPVTYQVKPEMPYSARYTTFYVIEPEWEEFKAANLKKLKKATLHVPLEDKHNFTFAQEYDLPRDYGNFIRLSSGHDPKSCRLDITALPFANQHFLDTQVYRTNFGAEYNLVINGTNAQPIYEYQNLITPLLKAPNVQHMGGLPQQFLIVWPGIQPKLYSKDYFDTRAAQGASGGRPSSAGSKENTTELPKSAIEMADDPYTVQPYFDEEAGNFSPEGLIKVAFGLPVKRYLSADGFFTMKEDVVAMPDGKFKKRPGAYY